MNISYVSYTRFPSERAHSIQVAHMCNAFVECGHSTTLVTTSRKSQVDRSFEEYFGVLQKFVQETIWIPEWSVRASWLTKFWQICFALACIPHVWRHKESVIYSRDEWVLYVFSLVFPRLEMVWESHEGKWNHAVKKMAHKRVPFVVISEGVHAEYIKRGVKASQLIVAHDAIDPYFLETKYSQADARKHLKIKEGNKVVLYAGGLDTWKGVDVLCQAAPLFQSEATLHIVGGRPEQLAVYKDRYPGVSFLGFYPYSQLPLIQQAADVLVIPNTSKNELSNSLTSPLKLYTYMASGVPIVASDVPSLRSVLQEGKCVYFTPDDSESLSQAIRTVLDHPEESKLFAEQALQLVHHKTWTNRVNHIMESIMVK